MYISQENVNLPLHNRKAIIKKMMNIRTVAKTTGGTMMGTTEPSLPKERQRTIRITKHNMATKLIMATKTVIINVLII